MYFLLNVGIFQPAMLVYWRLVCGGNMAWIRSNLLKDAPKKIAKYWLTTYPTYPFTDNASSTQAPVFQPPFGPSFLDGAGSCSKINLVPKCHGDFKLPSAQRAVMSWWFQTSKCPILCGFWFGSHTFSWQRNHDFRPPVRSHPSSTASLATWWAFLSKAMDAWHLSHGPHGFQWFLVGNGHEGSIINCWFFMFFLGWWFFPTH